MGPMGHVPGDLGQRGPSARTLLFQTTCFVGGGLRLFFRGTRVSYDFQLSHFVG